MNRHSASRFCWMFLAAISVAGVGVLAADKVVRLPGDVTVYGGAVPRVEAAGQVVNTNGILEFVAVETKGRTYESLLTLNCRPSVLQSALLLIGCETGAVRQTGAATAGGTGLNLDVAWVKDGKTNRAPVATWLREQGSGKTPASLPWVFNGSYFTMHPIRSNMVFLADEEQAHVAVLWMDSIPVNLSTNFGNPYSDAAQGFEVNTPIVPPVETPVTLIFEKSPAK